MQNTEFNLIKAHRFTELQHQNINQRNWLNKANVLTHVVGIWKNKSWKTPPGKQRCQLWIAGTQPLRAEQSDPWQSSHHIKWTVYFSLVVARQRKWLGRVTLMTSCSMPGDKKCQWSIRGKCQRWQKVRLLGLYHSMIYSLLAIPGMSQERSTPCPNIASHPAKAIHNLET